MSSIIFSGIGPLGPTSSRSLQGPTQVIYDLFKSKGEAEDKCRELQRKGIECRVIDAVKEVHVVLRIDPDVLELVDKGYRFIVIMYLSKTPY